MQSHTIIFEGKNIYYRTSGQGMPLLLLHGFGEDGHIWDNQAAALKNQCRLIIPDIPGSGQSQLLPNADIDTYADVIKAICDAEKLMPVNGDTGEYNGITLIGHSMGGYITLAFAEKYPGYLNHMGLFHSSALADSPEKKETRRKAIDFIYQKGTAVFLKTSIPGLFTSQFNTMHPDKIEQLLNAGKTFSPEALAQYYQAMINRPDRTHILKQFEQSILFIIGQHDQAVPFESSLQQCHLPKLSSVHILRNSAHMGMWEETNRVNGILRDFLFQY
jgi:pimeloyl-ACP methyl ester carboxylesterase